MTHMPGTSATPESRGPQVEPPTRQASLTQTIDAMVARAAAASPTRFEAELVSIDGLFSADAEQIILQILQECLDNIIKHAEASEAALTIARQPALVIISVRDNGRGFDANASSRARQAGFGLAGVAERVQTLGGALSIASLPGEGTTITIMQDVPETPGADLPDSGDAE